MSLIILRAGPSTLVQDLGRPGHAALGVTASGVADRAAAATALRATGTHPAAAVLEVLLGGFVAMTDMPAIAVVTGARGVVVVTDSDGSRRTTATGEVLRLAAGATIEISQPISGLRSYLAIRGGIDASVVLGSRSRDTLAGLGPAPLVAGDVLGVGDRVVGPWADGWHAAVGGLVAQGSAPVELDLIPGPRDDLFPPEAWVVLAATGRRLGALRLPRVTATGIAARPGLTSALALASAVALTAASVLVAGAVAFLGLAAPEIARRAVGDTSPRLQLPASAAVGATILVVADLLAVRTTLALPWTEATVTGVPFGALVAPLCVPVVLLSLSRRSTR